MKRFVHSQSEGKKANINKKKKEQNIGHLYNNRLLHYCSHQLSTRLEFIYNIISKHLLLTTHCLTAQWIMHYLIKHACGYGFNYHQFVDLSISRVSFHIMSLLKAPCEGSRGTDKTIFFLSTFL